MQRGLLTGITFGVAMVVFTLQNQVKVPVKLLWMKFTDVPLALILMISVLLGVTVTAVFSFIDKQRLKNRIKRLQSKLKESEELTPDNGSDQIPDESISDHGTTIEGEPGHKFFDY
jgi:uncharacterized integral membrane protein